MNALQEILAGFNAANATTLITPMTVDNVDMVYVQVLGSSDNAINTQGTIAHEGAEQFSGQVNIAWRRLQLEKLFMGISIVIKDPTATTTRQLVGIINAMYGTDIPEEDIVEVGLPSAAINAGVRITARDDALYVTGFITVSFTRA
jgi:hypothetical protein